MTYSIVELCQRAGITYRQIDYWTRAGYLPSPENVTYLGSGYLRQYTEQQAQFATALARLSRAGISIKVARDALVEQTVDGEIPDVLRIGDFEVRYVPASERVAS